MYVYVHSLARAFRLNQPHIIVPHIAAAVGTVSVRSLIEPLRKVAARLRGHLINARAVDLVMSERLLEVETIVPGGGKGQHMYIPCVVCPVRAWLSYTRKVERADRARVGTTS